MYTVPLKPLSVNKAWRGQRFKTIDYKAYEIEVWAKLPRALAIPPPTGGRDLVLDIEFGFSSAASDFDNPVKPFVDILQKRYNFDDRRIKRAEINVETVERGQEYIKFNLRHIAG